ncbi:hypothetical protein SAMN05216526_0775 [Ectothiorhodosinus mongolicus]|uniref:Uncharacterized protein n=1 Tax=Ectothiorhodosinus mongolicus TaxID=233100 RepID=A0A1R3VR27_9GAMM|nr:pentapeptide repeat-containing protein [Ectothiorhodosinus mongolicus]SIT67136.1 hypothetical protein SAMN05216526_0775 [Ectothiorhodosinus mongolicus]
MASSDRPMATGRTDPLISAKPPHAAASASDQTGPKGFYDALFKHLVDQIKEQHGLRTVVIQSILAGDDWSGGEDGYDWIYADERTQEQQSQAEQYEAREQLSQTPLTVHGIHFPPADAGLSHDYQTLLKPFDKLRFVECEFYGESLFEDRLASVHFENCVFHNDWTVSECHGFDESKPLFKGCDFRRSVIIGGAETGYAPIDRYDSVFEGTSIDQLCLENSKLDIELFKSDGSMAPAIRSIKITNCRIESPLKASSIKSIEEIDCRLTVFRKKFTLDKCNIGRISLLSVNFEGLASFHQSQFENVFARKCIFSDQVLFIECKFQSNQSDASFKFDNVTFESAISFRESQFDCPLDMRGTDRAREPDFLDTAFSKDALDQMDREAFRIIKHSFDSVGNHIEANRYFAHEMNAYRRELRTHPDRSSWPIRRERILLWINAVVSDHGQNYMRAASWLLATVIVSAIVFATFGSAEEPMLPESLVLLADGANTLAMGFLPLRGLMAGRENLAFFILLATVLISVFTWHLLVAVRRHSKR